MNITGIYPVIGTEHLSASKTFYVELLGMKPSFENDWYVSLAHTTPSTMQLAFVQHDHPSVPEGYRTLPQGFLVTVELDDVDAVYSRAQDNGHDVVLPLRDEPWGQRHFMVRDPNGVLVDVVKLIPPTEQFAESYRPV